LYCEILAKQKNPQELYQFLLSKNLDFYALNPSTLINIAEILLIWHREDKNFETLANRILSIALSGKIEEGHVVKAVVSLKKVGNPEDVIKFIGEALTKYPALATNPTLFQKRATSKMDLAKKCIQAGRDFKSTAKTRARAWEMCRQLLDEAEKDLAKALAFVENNIEKSFIKKDVHFLEKMKKIAEKPR
jgi:tetratricopeptide (TPR) repeat protein